jgi:hypothetical protein
MRDYFEITRISAPGGDKGKKLMKDPPYIEGTWEERESSQCLMRRSIPIPGPPTITFRWAEVDPPSSPLLPKKRKFKKTWLGGSRFHVEMPWQGPKLRKRPIVPPPPLPQDVGIDQSRELGVVEFQQHHLGNAGFLL